MKLLTTLFSLFLGALFIFAGNSLFLNATNLALENQYIPKTMIGLINMSYFFGAMLSSVVAHRIISRVGHTRSFSFFAAIMALGVLLHTLTSDIKIWTVIRFFQGFCYYGVLMIVESWLNEESETSMRSTIMGLYETVFYLAFSFGVLVLNFAKNPPIAYSYGAIFLILAIVPLSLTKIKAPEIPEPRKISIPSLYTISPLALVGALIGGFIVNGFISMAPSFTSSLGFNTSQTSIFISAAMLGGFLVQLPMGRFSDHYGRRLALSLAGGATATAAALSIGAIFLHLEANVQYFLGGLLGFGSFTIYALSVARANDALPQNSPNRLEVSRSVLFAYSLGALAAPLTLGFAMQYLGGIGFLLPFLLLSLFLARYSLTQEAIPKEEREAYVPMGAMGTGVLLNANPPEEEAPEGTEKKAEEDAKDEDRAESNNDSTDTENTPAVSAVPEDKTKPAP